ncbi:diguanylate cyclase (GGDEF)-like protein [Novosphingobium chloroacetimidivorans]|uniref:Diguanylate cyclase (GGDEF)-like protein n=1 Tax=Novosphingobium chloroacetimidivorans TaxID=1428314 RepID=A0A7W7NXV4_9SPHN|nr:bifunctional diguanylate cyclase/phosphodiesterase [Novosphingobium chloroacetimidivorans]MBB4860781.1 diguanylate cyclase (GGDEF)-like protein [Novosphingobium chloroacetimidivorans]
MRVLTCLVYEHDLWIVLLAAIMCLAGSAVSITLFRRTLAEPGTSRFHWCFLSAVTAGAATWATHFIAMLGYKSAVPVDFDGPLTIASALIAVAGIALGLLFAISRNRALAVVVGGGAIGLSIAAMHYTGMFAYRAQGIVEWRPAYVIASLFVASGLTMALIHRLRQSRPADRIVPCAMLMLAIVGLHFTGMAAFSVTPIPGVSAGADSETFTSVALSIAMVALLIVGTGISTYLLEGRTQSQSRDRLAHIAMHDALTGLANRHSFSATLESECGKLARYGRPFALLMLDLDRFKPINDTLGHPVGDLVLQRVANRLRQAVREGDLVARIGGDEFAIVAFGVADADQASALAARVVEIMSRPFVVGGSVAELGASVGIALAPDHGGESEQLIQHADVALYSAKRDGKDRFCLFETEMMDAMQRRRFLEVDLRRACMRDDFEVFYQPVIDSQTGVVTGAEALLRWHCPERGYVSPAEFIPIAEELGLVSRIGAKVLQQACRDATTWPEELDVAVNVSPVQLLDPRLPQIVSQALLESGLRAERLELEITETALLGDDEAALRTLNHLRDLGVRISLDDFGTGYSSLSYLHRFPISRIKIDRSFICRLPDDEGSASIVRAIAQLGESLDMKVTAEGIETSEQLSFIAKHGCDHVQGFLISRPIRVADFLALLEARAASIAA